jgi:phosphoglycolate phosphatase
MDLDQQWATKPLLLAAQRLGIVPTSAVYIGDDLRDIEAGKAAGMLTVAAAYGYCGSDVAPSNWGLITWSKQQRNCSACSGVMSQ